MNYFSLRGFVFLGAGLIILGIILYTTRLEKQLKQEAQSLSRIYARYSALAAFPEDEGVEIQIIFEEVIQRINFPVVFTDPSGLPLMWKNVEDELDSDRLPPGRREGQARLSGVLDRLDRENPPISMTAGSDNRVIGVLHYGDSPVIRELRYLPYIEILAVALFFLIAFYGYRGIKRTEESSIWVGMAKETAHQLGTPISSLMGWVELLNGEVVGGEGRGRKIVDEMSDDLTRLHKIASRFGKIGSMPELGALDLDSVLRDTMEYFRPRIPRFAGKVTLVEEYGDVGEVSANREILEWALENLIRNSLEALKEGVGTLKLRSQLVAEGRLAEITITDDGRGISVRDQRRVFQPGFTTKKRGWGLGLALARRIVETYHGGRLRLRASEPGRGTTFQILLPVRRSGIRKNRWFGWPR